MIHSADEFVRLREANDPRATHEAAPTMVWDEVIRRYPEMREWVVHNKTVPPEVLESLASDPDVRVRFAVAMTRRCPERVLELLADDEDESVRVRVACNAKVPAHILERLRNDGSPLVREAAEHQR